MPRPRSCSRLIPPMHTTPASAHLYYPDPPMHSASVSGGVQRTPRALPLLRVAPYRRLIPRPQPPSRPSSPPPTVVGITITRASPPSSIRRATRRAVGTGDEDEDDDDDELREDNAENRTERNKIPKPKGEFGKPNCGGYSIQKEAGWDDDTYTSIREWINTRADNKLNLATTFGKQDKAKIEAIRSEAIVKFPCLTQYSREWPFDALLRAHFKYKRKNMSRA